MARRAFHPRGRRRQIPEIGAEIAFELKRDDCECSISQLVPSEQNPLAWPWPDELTYKAIVTCNLEDHSDSFEHWMTTVLTALVVTETPDGTDITETLASAIDIWCPPLKE